MKALIKDSTISIINMSASLNRRKPSVSNYNVGSTSNGNNISAAGAANASNYSNGKDLTHDSKTFIKVLYEDNSYILANTLCSCLHMLNFIREKLRLSKEDPIDLIDLDGNLREVPSANLRDYAIHFVNTNHSYTVVKTEFDSNTNEKRYVCLLNEAKMSSAMTKTLNSLNSGKHAAKDKSGALKKVASSVSSTTRIIRKSIDKF